MLKADTAGATLPPAPTDSQRAAAEYASRALLLAGYALSAAKPSLADRRLAQLLLRECRKACAEASGKSKSDAPLFLLEAEQAPSADELRAAERELALRIKRLFGERDPRRVSAWLGLAFGALALLGMAALVVGALLPHPEYEDYVWTSSSGAAGFGKTGKVSDHGVSDLVFHTDNEQNPWVVIDTLRPRRLSQVILKNRADCCAERGLPMVVEVGMNAFSYTPVGRAVGPFDTWTIDFDKRWARYVRIRAEATTVLHLREVIVR